MIGSGCGTSETRKLGPSRSTAAAPRGSGESGLSLTGGGGEGGGGGGPAAAAVTGKETPEEKLGSVGSATLRVSPRGERLPPSVSGRAKGTMEVASSPRAFPTAAGVPASSSAAIGGQRNVGSGEGLFPGQPPPLLDRSFPGEPEPSFWPSVV